MPLKIQCVRPSVNTDSPAAPPLPALARADAAVQAASRLIQAGRPGDVVDFLLDAAADRPGLTEAFQAADRGDVPPWTGPRAQVPRLRTRHLRAQSSNKRATWNNRRIRIAVPTAQVPETGVLA